MFVWLYSFLFPESQLAAVDGANETAEWSKFGLVEVVIPSELVIQRYISISALQIFFITSFENISVSQWDMYVNMAKLPSRLSAPC